MSFLYITILCNITIFFTTTVGLSRKIIFSVYSLISVFICISFFLLAYKFEYMALLYIAVYVGAIAVLFIFIILLIGTRFEEPTKFSTFQVIFLLSFLLFSNLLLLYYIEHPINNNLFFLNTSFISRNMWLNSTFILGVFLYNTFSVWTILISVILLISMCGGLLLAIREVSLNTASANNYFSRY